MNLITIIHICVYFSDQRVEFGNCISFPCIFRNSPLNTLKYRAAKPWLSVTIHHSQAFVTLFFAMIHPFALHNCLYIYTDKSAIFLILFAAKAKTEALIWKYCIDFPLYTFFHISSTYISYICTVSFHHSECTFVSKLVLVQTALCIQRTIALTGNVVRHYFVCIFVDLLICI